MKINNHTKTLLNLLHEICEICLETNKTYYIAGGFAIDLQIGKITRNHKDIELYVDIKEMQFWKEYFENKKFKCIPTKTGFKYCFVVTPFIDSIDKYLDIHAFELNSEGKIINYNRFGEKTITNNIFKEIIEQKDVFESNNKIPTLCAKVLLHYKNIKEPKNTNDILDINILKSF